MAETSSMEVIAVCAVVTAVATLGILILTALILTDSRRG